MTTPAVLCPFALFGIDDAIIAIIVLAIIIAGALFSIGKDVKKLHDDTKRAEDAAKQQKALSDLQALVTAIESAGSATPAQCTELRRLLDAAIDAGVSRFVTGAIKTQIDKLCPGAG